VSCDVAQARGEGRSTPQPRSEMVMPASSTPHFRARLLVAEDNPVNLDIATRILETMGCNVVGAKNGAVAAGLLAREKFDLVFMDCEMPEMGGLEATKLARNFETSQSQGAPYRRVPIIALTSHALDDVRQKCLAAGMDDLIAKPFSIAKLRDTLHRWIADLESAEPAPSARRGMDAASPPPKDDAVIDRAVMDAVLQAQGKGGYPFLIRLYERFAGLAPRHMASLWENYRAGLPDALWRSAHNFKSGAGAVGARDLAARCAALEKEARENGLGGVEPMLKALETELAGTTKHLNILVEELGRRAGET
jgi:two-component system, sensor histidine kinase and response regulator